MKKLTFAAIYVMALCCFWFSAKSQTREEVYQANIRLIEKISPAIVLQNFTWISSIPRCSGQEGSVADSIVARAHALGLWAQKDTYNNALVRIHATDSCKNRPSVCLQVHNDGVCQGDPGPIQFVLSGDTLRAKGRTLDADDGIGDAIVLSIMQMHNQFEHTDLELVFTAGEEIGFVGASHFDFSQLKSRIIYNIDSETIAVLTVGSAGGIRVEAVYKPTFEVLKNDGAVYSLNLSGLMGGHSGLKIHEGHSNAIRVLAAVVQQKFPDTRLVSIVDSNGVVNKIATECHAMLFVPKSNKHFLQDFENAKKEVIQQNLIEKNLSFTCVKLFSASGISCLDVKSQHDLLTMIAQLPNGVMAMQNPDMMRTSSNMGILTFRDSVVVKMLIRSFSNAEAKNVLKSIDSVSRSFGGYTQTIGVYLAWPPPADLQNPFVKSVQEKYQKNVQEIVTVKITPGGLESGAFAEAIPDANILSYGPTLENPHTPQEYLLVSTIAPCFAFTLSLLK